MNKIITKIIFTLLLLSPFIRPADVAAFGITPAVIYHEHLKPGTHYETRITLSRGSDDEDLDIIVEPELGPISSWIKYDPGMSFVFPKGQKVFPLNVIIDVPADAAYKEYRGILRIKASSSIDMASGVSVVKGARMDLKLITTQIDVVQLHVRALSFVDATSDKDGNQTLVLKAKIENSGNTSVAPSKIVVNVRDLLNNNITDLINDGSIEAIPPGVMKEMEVKFKSRLSAGEYFGYVSVYLDEKLIHSDRLVFRIFGPTFDQKPQAEAPAANVAESIKNIFAKPVLKSLILALVVAIVALLIFRFILKRFTLLGILMALSLGALTAFAVSRTSPKPLADSSGDVKGESVVAEAEPTPTLVPPGTFQPLVVYDARGRIIYYIYEQPDLNSAKIYAAVEDNKFDILEETSQWYRVSIPDNRAGWLPKANVKRVD